MCCGCSPEDLEPCPVAFAPLSLPDAFFWILQGGRRLSVTGKRCARHIPGKIQKKKKPSNQCLHAGDLEEPSLLTAFNNVQQLTVIKHRHQIRDAPGLLHPAQRAASIYTQHKRLASTQSPADTHIAPLFLSRDFCVAADRDFFPLGWPVGPL